MNNVVLMGRLTRDPDIRHSQGENPITVARFTLAVDRRYQRRDREGSEPTADFISCVAFRSTADFIDRYIRKGTKIALTGSIQTGSYTNKDGQKVYTTDVVVDNVEFAESKRAAEGYSGGSGGSGYNDGYRGNSQQPSYNSPSRYDGPEAGNGASGLDDGFMNVPEGIDEDLPFN